MAEMGENIRRMREAKGLTQYALAVQIGTQAKQVNQWEIGAVSPCAWYLGQLADALECTVDEIMGRDAVRPVRCANCEHYKQIDMFGREARECKFWEVDTGPDGWCYRGKEKHG